MTRLRILATALAALALGVGAAADEAEIMAHFKAYNAAYEEGRYADAAVEGEAAWRAAEATWGAREETAVLAFNLARLQITLGKRAEAAEPASRALALVDEGVAGASITREEAATIAAYAELDPADPGRRQVAALEEALRAYAPTDEVGRSIAWQGWSSVAQARSELEQWEPAYDAASRAVSLMRDDPTAAPALHGVVATLGAKAALELDRPAAALAITHRGLEAFPPQPIDRPIDPVLGRLLGWDAGLHSIRSQRQRDGVESEDGPVGDLNDHSVWSQGRYPTSMGCKVEWIERASPEYPRPATMRGQFLALWLEYYLDADGSVIRVDPVGVVEEDVGFAEATVAAMRMWQATPQPRAECRGPWLTMVEYTLVAAP